MKNQIILLFLLILLVGIVVSQTIKLSKTPEQLCLDFCAGAVILVFDERDPKTVTCRCKN